METAGLIRKVHMECPICDKVHEIEERKRKTTVVIKGEKVVYEERFYYCANANAEESEFETGNMLNENLLSARNEYRKKCDFLL
ncbi:MAG: hypothetical protein NC124_13760 [Clostridium sp.]|nr:hypothetical protein [Clostridium sp.]